MKISIFTPFHKPTTEFIKEAYQSVLDQTHADWEWIILLNGVATHMENDAFYGEGDADFFFELKANPKIKIFSDSENCGNIGALKKHACSLCSGKILLELDYDDILTYNCLEEVEKAFEDDNIHMAYSNDALFIRTPVSRAAAQCSNVNVIGYDNVGNPVALENFVFEDQYGWKTRPFEYKGNTYQEMIAFEPSPQSFRRVEWAPDHVRAWRKQSYDKVGGHNKDLPIGDDHELCCRFYLEYGAAGIKHIDKCLYLYRKHDENQSVVNNNGIQEQTDKNYLKYRAAMAERWAKDNNLRLLDLGGRFGCPVGYESVDMHAPAKVIADLNGPWPFEGDSVGVIRASHFLEHLNNPIHAMNEAYRVLAPGGFFFIDVPSTDGRGAWQDPTHKSYWNSNSFWYYTNKFYAEFIMPEYTGRFQLARIVNWYPNEHFLQHNILVTQADLICLKPPYSDNYCGEVLI